MATRPPGRTSAASERATAGRSSTQFSAPKFEIAPSNDPPIRPSSSALQHRGRNAAARRATCTMAGEASVAYTATPRAAKCAASSPVPQPISRIRSPGWKSGSISRQTRSRWARPIGGGRSKARRSGRRCGRRRRRSSCLHLAVAHRLPGACRTSARLRPAFRCAAVDRPVDRSGANGGRGS